MPSMEGTHPGGGSKSRVLGGGRGGGKGGRTLLRELALTLLDDLAHKAVACGLRGVGRDGSGDL